MDNKNSFSLNLKRCLAFKRRCNTIDEFIDLRSRFPDHIKEPNHDDLIISTYSKYVKQENLNPWKIIKFLENNKKIIAEATIKEDIMGIYMAQMMIYNILTTNPMDVMKELNS